MLPKPGQELSLLQGRGPGKTQTSLWPYSAQRGLDALSPKALNRHHLKARNPIADGLHQLRRLQLDLVGLRAGLAVDEPGLLRTKKMKSPLTQLNWCSS